MDADWSVELGADDPALEFPWSTPDGSQQYVDLAAHPEAVHGIEEAVRHAPLREFLVKLNSSESPWQTVKCDVWLDDEVIADELIVGGKVRVGSYVDLIRRNSGERYSFERHESWVKAVAARLPSTDDDASECELIVRRCYYHRDADPEGDSDAGFYVTVYVFGYGGDEAAAEKAWAAGLTLVSSALAE